VTYRVKKLEEEIRKRFSNNWISVRRAFLDLDKDYDGFIKAEDIANLLGGNVDLLDLEGLLKNRDSKRQGKIDFRDFCRWMGTSIEPSEGFYFRHDSVRNPHYENSIKKQIKTTQKGI